MTRTRKEYIPHFALSACPSYEKGYDLNRLAGAVYRRFSKIAKNGF